MSADKQQLYRCQHLNAVCFTVFMAFVASSIGDTKHYTAFMRHTLPLALMVHRQMTLTRAGVKVCLEPSWLQAKRGGPGAPLTVAPECTHTTR